MLDNFSPQMRHNVIDWSGNILTALIIVGAVAGHLPWGWAASLGVVTASLAGVLGRYYTSLTVQYGTGEDSGAMALESDGNLPASADVDPNSAPLWAELPDPQAYRGEPK